MRKQRIITGWAMATILLLGTLVSTALALEPAGRQAGVTGSSRQEFAEYVSELRAALVKERQGAKALKRGSKEYAKDENEAAENSLREAADLYQSAADQLAGVTPPRLARRLHRLRLASLRDSAEGARMITAGISQNDQNIIDEGLRLYKSTVPKDKQAQREAKRLDRLMAE